MSLDANYNYSEISILGKLDMINQFVISHTQNMVQKSVSENDYNTKYCE